MFKQFFWTEAYFTLPNYEHHLLWSLRSNEDIQTQFKSSFVIGGLKWPFSHYGTKTFPHIDYILSLTVWRYAYIRAEELRQAPFGNNVNASANTRFCIIVPCVSFCTGHFVMVPLNMTYLHCLQHSLFEHLFNLYYDIWQC